jgi:tetratricopeptide (TPR) repeat protein
MFCSKCGKEMQEDAASCPSCGWSLSDVFEAVPVKNIESSNYGSANTLSGKAGSFNKLYISFLIEGAVILILALCFHVYIGNAGFKVFPKEGLTLSHTIITQEYIDKLIDEYNSSSIYDTNILNSDAFIKKLMDEGVFSKNNELAEQHYNNGTKYYEQEDYEKAVSEFSKAIALSPNHTNAYFNRGLACSDRGDYAEAIADYTQAIRIDPNNAGAYNNRGNAYNGKKDYDRAIADYTQALRINPNYAKAYGNRGNAHYNMANYDKAITDYTQVLLIDPNYTGANINRGNAYANMGNYKQAIADYTLAIKIDPNDEVAYYNRGLAYYNMSDYEQAITDYTQAIKINPNYDSAKKNLELARNQLWRQRW